MIWPSWRLEGEQYAPIVVSSSRSSRLCTGPSVPDRLKCAGESLPVGRCLTTYVRTSLSNWPTTPRASGLQASRTHAPGTGTEASGVASQGSVLSASALHTGPAGESGVGHLLWSLHPLAASLLTLSSKGPPSACCGGLAADDD